MGYRHRLSVHEWPLYRCQPQKIYISQSLQISLNSEKVGFSPLGDLMWNGAVDNQKQLWSQLQQVRCIPMHSTSIVHNSSGKGLDVLDSKRRFQNIPEPLNIP